MEINGELCENKSKETKTKRDNSRLRDEELSIGPWMNLERISHNEQLDLEDMTSRS